jgi:hypothetical protein
MEAKHAADTEPTYPNPKMLTDRPKPALLAMPNAKRFPNYINLGVTKSKRFAIGAP